MLRVKSAGEGLSRMRLSNWQYRTILLVFLLIGSGCNGGGGPSFDNLVPVSGTVTYNGEPLEQGVVSFAPIDPRGQSATGKVTDGKFTMQTTVSAPGVIAGKYKVMIESIDTPDRAPSTNPNDLYPKSINLIPEKYRDAATSGIEIEVVSGMPAPDWKLEP